MPRTKLICWLAFGLFLLLFVVQVIGALTVIRLGGDFTQIVKLSVSLGGLSMLSLLAALIASLSGGAFGIQGVLPSAAVSIVSLMLLPLHGFLSAFALSLGIQLLLVVWVVIGIISGRPRR